MRRRALHRWGSLVALLAAAVLIVAAKSGARAGKSGTRAQETPPTRRLLVVRLEGVVSPVMAEVLDDAIDRAERQKYSALVVEIDTPGGLETSMRAMVRSILASEVPILTWVSPSGARAASAGVFVTMAGDVAAMSPGTNIGAATPVNMQGPMDSTLARKATNDASAFARTIAAQRGRNAVWAEQAVRQAVSVSETEAVQLDVVDLIAGSLPDLAAKADGKTWRRGEEVHTLATKGLPFDRIEPGFRQRLMSVLADPNVAYILLMLGFYGLMFELQNPGAILPGVVGGICLILAFFALSTLPVNTAGVALIVLAIVFFIAEVKVASHGLLGAGGVISLLLGSLFLFQGHSAHVSWGLILGATLATTLFFLFIVQAGLRAQRSPVRTGSRGLLGVPGVAIERLAPSGRVRVGNEVWNAVCETGAEIGSEIEITGVNGLTLTVRPKAKEVRPT